MKKYQGSGVRGQLTEGGHSCPPFKSGLRVAIIVILCLLPTIGIAASNNGERTDGQGWEKENTSGTLSLQQTDRWTWTSPVPTIITKAPILPTKDLPPSNDCRILKKKHPTMTAPLLKAPLLKAPPYGGDFYDTSSYMTGKIAVGIILPESTGNSENWTQDEVKAVIDKIKTAMNWWASIEPDAHLSFYYDIHTPFDGTQSVKIANEPIQTSEEKTWINQVMNALGYTDPGTGLVEDYFYCVFDYNNHIRDMLRTHWAFTIFVADSSNDTDGEFPDDMFAYAYLGGPFMVMTYDNGSYEIKDMDAVCAHESGHIFYALDEYIGESSKTEHSGYLDVINANHESAYGGVPCIMKGLISPFTNHQVCYYTRGQLGLWDTDMDNILDVLDSPPQVSLTPYSPDPTSTQTPTYYGHAMVTAIPNKNPQEDEPLYNITINTISQIEYRINNNSWSSATALDGIFDEPEEEFTFTPSTLSYGTHTFSVRAIDSVWNVSNYSTDTLTIYMEKMQATGLMIDPATITVTTGNTVEYNGTARDTAGNTWTVTGATAFSIGDPWGTITGNVYTAGKVGTWTIIGNHAGLFATATVIITQDILHHIVIEPDMAVVQIQGKQVFCAGGYDQYDNYLPGILFDWTVEDGLGDLSSSYDTQTTLTAGKFITSGRIIASNNGISGYATVTITSGELGYFQFERIDNQQAGDEFPITITAHDRYHNLIDTFIDAVDLSDVTGSIMPQHTGRFINGSWSGMVTIDKLWLGTNITAKYQEICGTSSNFSSLIDDDIGTSTVGSVTIRFNPGDINGTDYLFIITPDVSSPAIERANKGIQQHPWVKQMISLNVRLVDGDNKPITQGFNSSVIMTIPCLSNLDAGGILQIYQLDGDKWEKLAMQPRINQINHQIWFAVPSPGTYTITNTIAQPNLESMVVYPVPFRQQIGDTHIIFKGLTNDANIRIYDLAGDIIREQEHVSIIWKWPVIDEGISSGVYFFVVTEEGKGERVGKIVIIR